ncbi:NAD-dependent dehydratase [Lysobacter sp. CA199]|uniref:NAD-dependent dehydratase n=1 Tax=Lysobacter sp. CA199 TaxID=3455608 RepID=UPI003F8D254B
MKLLLAGATGLVGSHVLRLALADPGVERVIAPVRRALPTHPKLEAPVIEWDALPRDAPWWRADAVICALGTTMRAAGSQQAFVKVDHDYPLDVARLARGAGAATYALNSAIGADPRSRLFYNRVKGELERELANQGFVSLTYVRPGMISGQRQESRPGERALIAGLSVVGPLLPKRWRLNPAARIAQALLDAARDAMPGIHVVASDRLV